MYFPHKPQQLQALLHLWPIFAQSASCLQRDSPLQNLINTNLWIQQLLRETGQWTHTANKLIILLNYNFLFSPKIETAVAASQQHWEASSWLQSCCIRMLNSLMWMEWSTDSKSHHLWAAPFRKQALCTKWWKGSKTAFKNPKNEYC